MKARIQKLGNGLALRIPKSLAKKAGIAEDSVVELFLEHGQLVIRSAEKPRLTLKELLKGITPENRHPPIDWGPPVGKEIW